MKNFFKQIGTKAGKVIAFIKSIFSESDGMGSASRTAKLTIIFTSMACLVFVVIVKKDLPTAEQLTALAKVIGAGSVAYVGNQIAGAINKTPDEPDPPESQS